MVFTLNDYGWFENSAHNITCQADIDTVGEYFVVYRIGIRRVWNRWNTHHSFVVVKTGPGGKNHHNNDAISHRKTNHNSRAISMFGELCLFRLTGKTYSILDLFITKNRWTDFLPPAYWIIPTGVYDQCCKCVFLRSKSFETIVLIAQ